MYQNIITDVIKVYTEQPNSLDDEMDRYEEEWMNSSVYVYITPKDPASDIQVLKSRLFIPTYSKTREIFGYYEEIPLNINMWNPIALDYKKTRIEILESQGALQDFDVYLGRIG